MPELRAVDQLSILQSIINHLDAAIRQSVPSDDQIIMGHVRTAHELAELLLSEARK